MFFSNFNRNNFREMWKRGIQGGQLFNVIQRLYRVLSHRSRILKEFVCLTANDPMKEKRHGHLVFSYLKSCTVCIS